MRENRTDGSEGGEDAVLLYPYQPSGNRVAAEWQPSGRRVATEWLTSIVHHPGCRLGFMKVNVKERAMSRFLFKKFEHAVDRRGLSYRARPGIHEFGLHGLRVKPAMSAPVKARHLHSESLCQGKPRPCSRK